MWHFWTPTDVNRSLAYDVCGLGHRVHGDTRTGAKPLLFANLDQEEVVPTHHSLHLLPLLHHPLRPMPTLRQGLRREPAAVLQPRHFLQLLR